MNKIKEYITYALGVAIGSSFVLLLIAIEPFLVIWAINTIGEYSTGFYIDHNVWTYLAVIVLVLIFKVNIKVSK